ncbi:MAG: hypothetical protein NC205_01805 [Prevotella sp.]|nr:hypothetical protein [Alistipes senegalensis]MCM1357302.1 hypothetical protein [Prevotella sp.]MCM1473557.1 hypothetical protein [Muribaculaceae bacterium]
MYNKISLDKGYILIDNICLNHIFEKIQGSNNFFEWLVPSVFVENSAERRYIYELIKRKISCNFPILVCDCDLDFSCKVVVVKTVWTENAIIWTKFGTVKKDVNYLENYNKSGILRVEDWTESDWNKYGSIAYDLIYDENFYNNWCYNNWCEESYRRTWGYYHKYFNDDKNIDWIGEVSFRFNVDKYQKIFSQNV